MKNLNRQNSVTYYYYEDFDKTSIPFATAVVGTGASVANAVTSSSIDNNVAGVIILSTGTQATGCARMYGNQTVINFGGADLYFETVLYLPRFATPDNGILRFGFGDVITATNYDQDFVNGIYFEWTNLSSPNWWLCASNASTRTKINSGVAVTLTGGLWLKYSIRIVGATNAYFYINGTLIGQVSTNIPAISPCGLNFYSHKVAGTTNMTLGIDYISLSKTMKKARGSL